MQEQELRIDTRGTCTILKGVKRWKKAVLMHGNCVVFPDERCDYRYYFDRLQERQRLAGGMEAEIYSQQQSWAAGCVH